MAKRTDPTADAAADAAAPGAAAPDAAAPDGAALDAVAAELYVLPPDTFTGERNARAAASAKTLAGAIKALKKPSVAAWAVNLLAREGQLDEALELAAALREAQDDLDAAELSRLGRQRRQLVAGLARQAAELAAGAGTKLSAAARDDVSSTLNAAMTDAAAAAAVATGRLARTLEASGSEEVDLAGAVGGSVAGVAPPVRRPVSKDELAERRARKEAEKEAREADRAASEAGRARDRAESAVAKARERADLLHERIEELRAQLDRVAQDAATADDEVSERESDLTAAAKTAKSAAAAAERARAALH